LLDFLVDFLVVFLVVAFFGLAAVVFVAFFLVYKKRAPGATSLVVPASAVVVLSAAAVGVSSTVSSGSSVCGTSEEPQVT